MACELEQAAFGPPFSEMDEDVFALYLSAAEGLLFGACGDKVTAQWMKCCLNPCTALMWLTKHIIAVDPKSGAGSKDVVSKSVGDVSVTYANASSTATIWAGSPYGLLYASELSKFERCKAKRRHGPIAARGGGCTSCQ
jgi:hypothetical protein